MVGDERAELADPVTAPVAPAAAARIRPRTRLVLLGVAALALFSVGRVSGLGNSISPESLRVLLANAGVFGVLLFVLAFSLGLLAQLPGILFITVAVLVYGRELGTLIALGGSIVAVSVSFVVVRRFGGHALTEMKSPLGAPPAGAARYPSSAQCDPAARGIRRRAVPQLCARAVVARLSRLPDRLGDRYDADDRGRRGDRARSAVRASLRFVHAPTPLDEAPRLSAELGLRLLVKRDDQTGLALGGNKARKLELLVADAIGARLRHLDRDRRCAIELRTHDRGRGGALRPGVSPSSWRATSLRLRPATWFSIACFGASVEFAGSDDWRVLEERVGVVAARLGPRAYAMPIGGSTPLGALAYVGAAAELLRQMDTWPDWIVLADSSGGTHAGLLAGLPAAVRVLGIAVARPPVPLERRIATLATTTAALAGRPPPAGELILADHTGVKYAAPTAEGSAAIALAARSEGLVLDPVYTGKAMAGLIAATRAGRLRGTVVFWHTGGAPALFADEFRPS